MGHLLHPAQTGCSRGSQQLPGVARVEAAAPVQREEGYYHFNLSDIEEGIKEVTVKVTDLFKKYTYGKNALTNRCSSRSSF